MQCSNKMGAYHWHDACQSAVYVIEITIITYSCNPNTNSKPLELETSNLVCSFVLGMPSGRTKISSKSGRGLSHVTPKIFGI